MGYRSTVIVSLFPLYILMAIWLSSPHYGLIVAGVNVAFIALLLASFRYIKRIDFRLVLAAGLILLSMLNSVWVISENCTLSCSSFFAASPPAIYVFMSGVRYIIAFYIFLSLDKFSFITAERVTATCKLLISVFFLVGMFQLRRAPNLFQFLLGIGSLLFIVLQAVINIGVVTGSFPTKGMSLPFISYGGSNLVVVFVFTGILLNLFRQWEKPIVSKARELEAL